MPKFKCDILSNFQTIWKSGILAWKHFLVWLNLYKLGWAEFYRYLLFGQKLDFWHSVLSFNGYGAAHFFFFSVKILILKRREEILQQFYLENSEEFFASIKGQRKKMVKSSRQKSRICCFGTMPSRQKKALILRFDLFYVSWCSVSSPYVGQ